MESYAAGETTPPLLEQTIGDHFESVVARHGDREALVEVASGRRWTYAELDADVERAGPGADGRRRRQGRPGRHLGAELRGVDAGAVRHRQDRRDHRQRQPGLPHPRAGLRPEPVRAASCWSAPRRSSPATTARWSRRSRPATPTPWSGTVYIGTRTGTSWSPAARRSPEEALRERMGALEPGDPINIQYTSGTTGFPKGATLSHRNILNNGFFVTETINFTEQDRLAIPVPFYHCFGMVMGNLGCTTHGAAMIIPAPGFDPSVTLQDRAGRALHRRVRRPDDVHRDAERPRLRGLRPVHAAHRDHGRLDLPGRGDEALPVRHAHGRGVDRLRHDRDVAGLHADPQRRRPGPPYVDHRPGPPARRDQGGGPGHRRDRRAGRDRRAVHPRLLGDDRLLGRPRRRPPRRSMPTAGCTPATSR